MLLIRVYMQLGRQWSSWPQSLSRCESLVKHLVSERFPSSQRLIPRSSSTLTTSTGWKTITMALSSLALADRPSWRCVSLTCLHSHTIHLTICHSSPCPRQFHSLFWSLWQLGLKEEPFPTSRCQSNGYRCGASRRCSEAWHCSAFSKPRRCLDWYCLRCCFMTRSLPKTSIYSKCNFARFYAKDWKDLKPHSIPQNPTRKIMKDKAQRLSGEAVRDTDNQQNQKHLQD